MFGFFVQRDEKWGRFREVAIVERLVLVEVRLYNNYSQTLLHGHPPNMDTSSLWTACFVSWERKPLHFLLIQPAFYRHSINTDTFYGPTQCQY